LRISHFSDLNFVSVSTDISCDVSWYLHSADSDSDSENEFCVTSIQLGWDQEFVRVKLPFMLAQSSFDPSEKADWVQEAIHPKHYEMAVGELPNLKKKSSLEFKTMENYCKTIFFLFRM
jgi:hypothetical protein